MGLFNSDTRDTETKVSAELLEDRAEGNVKSDDLVRTHKSGVISKSFLRNGPILKYLGSDEQPHYKFDFEWSNLANSESYSGVCSLVITDNRILTVSGKETEDEIVEFPYTEITKVAYGKNKGGWFIRITDESSKKVYFYSLSYPERVIEESYEFISEKINEYKDKHTDNKTDSTPHSEKSGVNEVSDQQDRKLTIEKETHSIRSDLAEVDSLATDAEFQQARQLVDEIESRITEVRQEALQEGFDTLETEIQQLERKCKNRLSKPHVLSQLREMDPYEFEELVAKIWEKQGWDAEATSGSTDRGVDVVATKEDAFEKRRHLIQVKRHGENSKVGSEDIQQYASLYQRDEQVDNVFVVTSNEFTKEAKAVAERRDVSTVNGDELYEMLTET